MDLTIKTNKIKCTWIKIFSNFVLRLLIGLNIIFKF